MFSPVDARMHSAVTAGMRVRLLRTVRRLELGELAARAKVSRATVNNLEADRFSGRLSTLDSIARVLDVEPAALADDDACLVALARIAGASSPKSSPPADPLTAEIATLLREAGPERSAQIVQLVRAMLGLVGSR